MAELVAGIGASHAPSITSALESGEAADSPWRPLFAAFEHVREWVTELSLDALVVIYNDHCEEFFIDRCPTFSIGVADSFEVLGHDGVLPPARGHRELGLHIATAAIEHGIDFTVCQQQGVDNGVVVPLPLIDDDWVIPIVPININVVWEPRPTPARCWAMGAAVGAAIRSYDEPLRVGVIGTGGLSHQLVGRDFGAVRPEWDRRFLRQMEEAPDELRAYTMAALEREAGHEGVEVVQWIAMRAALGGEVRAAYTCYYPYRMTGYAVACYEPVHSREPVEVR
jgi:protocatechuate 4,5-dioxygenase, beta chain